jgi:trehalose 6-phosphate phosphatase
VPSAAYVSDVARAALQKLVSSGRFLVVALLSGRAALEACQLVNVPGTLCLGNHGMEIVLPGGNVATPVEAVRPYPPVIAATLEALKTRLYELVNSASDKAGEVDWPRKLLFEDKGVTASIHYRLCANPDFARQAILQVASELARQNSLKVSEGRMVVELRPPVQLNKGTALSYLQATYSLKGLIYLGDDITDVDGFLALKRLEGEQAGFRGLAIGVRSKELPPTVEASTDFLLDEVAGVEEFLTWLASQVESRRSKVESQGTGT